MSADCLNLNRIYQVAYYQKTSHSGDPVSVHPLPCLATGTTVHINGVGTNFRVGVGEARPEEPRAGNGFLGGDSQPLPTN